jgi:hypothetical protein
MLCGRKKIRNGRHTEAASGRDTDREPERLASLDCTDQAGFAIKTFLDGTRTAEERLSAIMPKADILVAERHGQTVVCV